MNLIQDTIGDFLLSLEDDHTELWVISRYLHDRAPDLSISEICSLTKQVVKELIEKYKVREISMITKQYSDLTIDDANKKIDKIFLKSGGRLPTVGDGFWLTKE